MRRRLRRWERTPVQEAGARYCTGTSPPSRRLCKHQARCIRHIMGLFWQAMRCMSICASPPRRHQQQAMSANAGRAVVPASRPDAEVNMRQGLTPDVHDKLWQTVGPTGPQEAMAGVCKQAAI